MIDSEDFKYSIEDVLKENDEGGPDYRIDDLFSNDELEKILVDKFSSMIESELNRISIREIFFKYFPKERIRKISKEILYRILEEGDCCLPSKYINCFREVVREYFRKMLEEEGKSQVIVDEPFFIGDWRIIVYKNIGASPPIETNVLRVCEACKGLGERSESHTRLLADPKGEPAKAGEEFRTPLFSSIYYLLYHFS